MSKRKKQYWEMTTAELAAATKAFDDPAHDPPARKPTARQAAQLRRWQGKRAAKRGKLEVSLERRLIEQTDDYAASRGMTVSDVVSSALRRLMRKKSA
jgi:hypothetical protein